MRLVGSWHLPRRSSANSRQGTQQLSSNGAPSSVVPADDGIPVGRLGLYVLTGHVFGKGANGRVYQGRHSITGQEVALKQLTDGVAASRAGGGRRSGADVAPPREVLAMRHLPPHPNIAQLVEHVCVNGQHYIVMEPCYGGELFAQVEASGSLPEEYVLRLTRGAASAVSHMHSHGVAHRDLKLENMLVSEQGGECVKICDFGLAHVHALGPPPRRGDDLLGVCQSAELLVRVCGTKSYAAPEVGTTAGGRLAAWARGSSPITRPQHPPLEGTERPAASFAALLPQPSSIPHAHRCWRQSRTTGSVPTSGAWACASSAWSPDSSHSR